MSHGGGIQERIPSRPGSTPASPGVQERIGALRIGGGAVSSPRPAASSPLHRALGTSASPAVARNANYTPAPSLVTDGGGIQERIRMAPGTEIARTVAVRRSHVPSHYAMLGVPRDFSPELLKKQYRLLALRYHPDAAERNGVDADEVAERFIALQTAYEVAARAISAQFGAQFSDATTASQVLSDPERRGVGDVCFAAAQHPEPAGDWGHGV